MAASVILNHTACKAASCLNIDVESLKYVHKSKDIMIIVLNDSVDGICVLHVLEHGFRILEAIPIFGLKRRIPWVKSKICRGRFVVGNVGVGI